MKFGSLLSTTGGATAKELLGLVVLELEVRAVLELGVQVVKREPPLFFW